MTKSEFQEALHLGLGRAIAYARDNDVQPFRDLILDHCLHCYSYDPQCEGTRADYMLELVSPLPDRQFYCNEVLTSLSRSGDDWDAVHCFRFAACMAMDGDEFAKRTMYESFRPEPSQGQGIAINFVQMDGLKGFLFAASSFGSKLISNPDEKLSVDWLWFRATEICGEQEARNTLLQASATDPSIEAYRTWIEAYEAKQKSTSPVREIGEFRAFSYEQLKRAAPSRHAFRLRDWGKHASPEQLLLAANGLLNAGTSEEQLQHLHIFTWRAFPLYPTPLVKLSLSEDERVGRKAADALTQVAHSSVRETAGHLIRGRLPGREHAIEMLNRNFEPGDHALALGWFENESDADIRHRMEMDLKTLREGHPEPTSEPRMLHALYERGPCSFCRESVVRRLIELDALFPSMRAECAFDANDDIRNLVKPIPERAPWQPAPD